MAIYVEIQLKIKLLPNKSILENVIGIFLIVYERNSYVQSENILFIARRMRWMCSKIINVAITIRLCFQHIDKRPPSISDVKRNDKYLFPNIV